MTSEDRYSLDPAEAHARGLHDDESDLECAACREVLGLPAVGEAPAVDLDYLEAYARALAQHAVDLYADVRRLAGLYAGADGADALEAAHAVDSLAGHLSRQGATVVDAADARAYRDIASGLYAASSPHRVA